ncbi:MAG: hypothetical protein AAF639_27470 [Chloroflexota bacterium]
MSAIMGRGVLDILRRIEDKITDKKSFVESANRIVDLKPNIAGIGLNLNELIEVLYQRFST